MRPLAVTGLGVVSPLGVGWEAFVSGLWRDARDPFSPTTSLFDLAPYGGARVAEVQGFDAAKYVGDKGLRNNDRLTRLLLVAARLGLEHAGLKSKGAWAAYGPDDVGVVAASAYGSLEAIHELNTVARREDPRYINPARFPNTVINSSLGYVSIWEDLRALNATVINGPAGALDAVSCAEMYLATGRAKAALVGGAEALSEALVLAAHRLGALDLSGDAAWSPARGGGVRLGEGSVLAVMEPEASARARGARVYATVAGYGTAFEPPDDDDALFAPSQKALERAMRAALSDASLDPSKVDAVLSGVSGWAAMDDVERAAVEAVLGRDAARRVATPKAFFGETLGASGAFAVAAAAAGFEAGVEEMGRAVLVPSLGFYGNASALVVRRPE